MNFAKKLFAMIALVCVAFATVALITICLMGRLQELIAWALVPFTGFLMTGLISLAIQWIQKRVAENKVKEP